MSKSSLPLYPISSIINVREAFERNWRIATERNPVALRIHEAHWKNPPRISVLNTEPYPFEAADSFYPTPDILLLRDRQPGDVFGAIKLPNACDDNDGDAPSSVKRRRLTPSASAIAELTEQAVSAGLSVSETINKARFTYACDVCPVDNMSRDEANTHMNLNRHFSCSQYVCETLEEDTDPEGGHSDSVRTLVQLTLPRMIIRNTLDSTDASDYGWQIRDTVIICPTCHLILPDKILAGFHHQLQHPLSNGLSAPAYAFGTVLASSVFSMDMFRPVCNVCNATFLNIRMMQQHWATTANACNPFRTSETCTLLVHFACMHCNIQSDRTVCFRPPAVGSTGADQTTNLTLVPEINQSATSKSQFVAMSMLQHVKNHQVTNGAFEPCSFRFRFISVKVVRGHPNMLPPFARRSHHASLLHSFNEIKRLKALLKLFPKTRKELLKQANIEYHKITAAIARCLTTE